MPDPHPRTPWLVAAATAGLLVPALLQGAAAQSGVGSRSGFGSTGPSSFGRSTGSFTTAPSTVAPAPRAFTPSALGTPAPQVAPVAPLSPPTTSTFLGSGGTTVTTPGGITTTLTPPSGLTTSAPGAGTTATFPGGGGPSRAATASASEAAPSSPGGGAPGIQACLGFWDAGTHMTRREWAAACRRTEDRLSSLRDELAKAAQGSQPGATAPKREPRTPASRPRISGAR
jgi:hypothetical protein